MSHHPVLLNEVIAHLHVRKGGLYIDATFGEGGHSLAILEKGGMVLGIELDKEQYQISKINGFDYAHHCPEQSRTDKYQKYISNIKNLILVKGNFKDIEIIAKEHGFFPVDGILFDLGLSMRQLAESGRGFSYKNKDEPLDMRLDLNEETTAKDYLNTLSEENLYELFAKNAEEINSRPIARAIISARKVKKLRTVGDLTGTIERAIGRKDNAVLARIFQSLRIEVNHEFENLKKGLEGAKKIIKKDGMIAVITFHSLEDRIVKKLEGKKITILRSRFSFERSAKLRIIVQ